MSEDYFSADMGTIWMQPDGPNTAPRYLGCHDMGDIAEPIGDITQRFCPDPAGHGKWNVALTSQAMPGRVTTSITTYVGATQDYLQQLREKNCPTGIYVHSSLCGRKDTFLNYDAGTMLRNAKIISRTKTKLAAREGADASEMTFEISADPPLAEYWPLRMTRLTTAETTDAWDIAIGGESFCSGPCGPTELPCDELAVGCDHTAAAPNVLFSGNGGTTWAAVASTFGVAEPISSVIAVQYGRGVTRYIIARGITAAGAAQIAYTDNLGAAWTLVTVGAVATEFIPWNGDLFALDLYHIWAGTDTGAGAGGHVYFSADGGATWALQLTTADVVKCIHFANYTDGIAVGDSNGVYATTDGGTTWTTITGPAGKAAVNILSCWCFDRYRWFVGYDDGTLHYTTDGGVIWAQRLLPMPPSGTAINRVNAMSWIDDYHGCLAVKYTVTAALWGAIYRTFDGGYDWEIYHTAAAYTTGAIGMASVVMCSENLAYGVGDICTATSTIYKLSL
jgi:photosystem II stability/assembly factor-like uncharacterized protein